MAVADKSRTPKKTALMRKARTGKNPVLGRAKSTSLQAYEEFQHTIVRANPGARITILRSGVNAVALAGASEFFNLSRSNIGKIIGIAPSTAERKIKEKGVLGLAESERLARLAMIESEAEEVFGSDEKAKQWLLQENLALGSAPLSLLDTETGAAEVRKALSAIAWGGVV